MSYARLIPVGFVLALAACDTGKTFENLQMPTGYALLDTTPVSSPHGYNKTQSEEDAARDEIAAHADAWKAAVINALSPISSVLDMSQPVAITAAPPLTPLNAAAANYTRDVMIGMNYLTALPADTTQIVHVDAERTGKDTDQTVSLKLSIERDGITYASRTIEINMKPQESETSTFPTWSHLDDPVVPVKEAPATTLPAQTTVTTPMPTALSPISPETPMPIVTSAPASTGTTDTKPHPRGLAKPLVGQ